jgi:hypothetical protein
MRNREVVVRLAGAEVAKWFGRVNSSVYAPVGPPDQLTDCVGVVGASPSVVIDFGDALRLPTLAEDSEVEMLVFGEAFAGVDPSDSAAVIGAAIDEVNRATGGLASRAESVEVTVRPI